MNVLITGGFGYLGGRVAQYLMHQPNVIVILGSRNQQNPPEWLPKAKVVKINWKSKSSLESICSNIDVIVHLAGMNSKDCSDNSLAALEFNTVATARLLDAAICKKVKRIIYISTAHVYASPLVGNISEETCPRGLHPYATSHRAAEDVIMASHQKSEIDGVVLRLSNAFGSPVTKDVNCWMLLVNDLCKQAAVNNNLVLNSSGSQRRDFIAISDVCLVIEHFIFMPRENIDDGLYNVGGEWTPTILEMAEYIAEVFYNLTGSNIEVSCQSNNSIDRNEFLNYNISKLIKTGFRFNNEDTMREEVIRLVEFCLDNFK